VRGLKRVSGLTEQIGHLADAIGRYWPLYVAIGAVFAIMQGAVRWFRKMLQEALKPIVTEITYNGGSSMKDAVRRIDEGTARSHETQTVMVEKLDQTFQLVSGADARVQALRASTKQPYVEMDAELNHVFVNQAYTDLFGVEYTKGMGDMEWESRVHPDDVYRLTQLAERLKETPQSYQVESRIVNTRVNEIINVISYGYPMVNPDGSLGGYAATVEVLDREPLPTHMQRFSK
jgi:PAS domain-containing protein